MPSWGVSWPRWGEGGDGYYHFPGFLGKWGMFGMMMLIVFVLIFLADWIAIIYYITFPIFLPFLDRVGFDRLWFLIVMAVNLQISFLTPPLAMLRFV